MSKRCLFITTLLATPVHAADIKPWLTLTDLFKSVPDRVRQMVEANPFQLSDYEKTETTASGDEAGMALVSASRDMSTRECFVSECSTGGVLTMSQQRGGLAWNLPVSADFNVAAKAEVVHYERITFGQRGKQQDMGVGFGMDSQWRLSESVSAYLSAGVMQTDYLRGYEGLVGVSHKVHDSRYFAEATWMDMASNARSGISTDANQFRVGIAHAFSLF